MSLPIHTKINLKENTLFQLIFEMPLYLKLPSYICELVARNTNQPLV
jgi:hypothetical protein